MTKNVFSPKNLEELRDAVVDVFNIFAEVLAKPCSNYEDLRERLEVVDAVKWESIRAKYLEEDHTGYGRGNFTAAEGQTVVKILYDFISLTEKASQTIIEKLETKGKETETMADRVKQMEERVKKTEAVMHAQEEYYKERCSDNAELLARIAQQQAELEERGRKISELQKDTNVLVWETEKKRIIKEAEEKNRVLLAENEELKNARDTLKRRNSNMEDSMKMLKMKNQMVSEKSPQSTSPSPSADGSTGHESNDKLSRLNFMQDKDIVYLEKQLYDLQTSSCGVIGGMKTDLGMLTMKFFDPTTGETDPEFSKLKSRMENCHTAFAEGNVQQAKETLPPHYKFMENDKFKIKRIRRLSSPAIVPNQRVISSVINEKKTASVSPTLNGISETPVNPVIVNPTTKKLHPINPLKYFGHMSQSFILEQYQKFSDFDKNGDGSLDLTEMVKVVKQLGFSFTAHQLQEAMEEVDRDNNHTLDFFEFLLIIDNIYKKSGKAAVFKEGMNELQKKNASKTCAIQ